MSSSNKCSFFIKMNPDQYNYLKKSLEDPYEIGHVMYFKPDSEKYIPNKKYTLVSTSLDSITKGVGMSVYTPLGAINLHTHPKSAYKYENCLWGWPSGEDMAEVIRYSASGMMGHFVVTVEGTYTLQVNPCFLKFFSSNKLTDRERGILYKLIYVYFSNFHSYRTKNNVKKFKSKKITPKFFVNLANKFKLETLEKNVGVIDGSAIVSEDYCDYFMSFNHGRSSRIQYINPEGMIVYTEEFKLSNAEVKVCINKFTEMFNKLSCKNYRTSIFHATFIPKEKIPHLKVSFGAVKQSCPIKKVLEISREKTFRFT